MQEDTSQLLAQLQDIHTAAGPGWWPPAPGWWLIVVILLILLVLALRGLARKLAVSRRRRSLLRALDQLNLDTDPRSQAHEYIAGLNRLFRVVALKAFPGSACARMQGEEWVAFIRALQPAEMDTASLSALAQGPYEPVPEFDADALNEQARVWVRRYG